MPAATKEIVHPFCDVCPGAGAFVLLRGATGQEVIVVRVGRAASSRVRTPSSNIYVFAQVAAQTVEVVVTRQPIVHQARKLVLLFGGLPTTGINTAATLALIVTKMHQVALATTTQVIVHVDVGNVSSASPTSWVIFRINYQLRGAVSACYASAIVVVRIRYEKALVLVFV